MTLEFDAERHIYTFNGVRLPSVTKIIGAVVDRASPWWTDESRDRGREVHALTAQYDRGEELDPEMKDKWLGYLNGWLRFRRDHKLKFSMIEQPVVNELYRYTGTLDRLGTRPDGKHILLDIKSGATPWSASFQLWAYDLCLPQDQHRDHMVVELRKEGTYKLRYFCEPQDKNLWLAAVSLYHRNPDLKEY